MQRQELDTSLQYRISLEPKNLSRRAEAGGPIWYEQHIPFGRTNPTLFAEAMQPQEPQEPVPQEKAAVSSPAVFNGENTQRARRPFLERARNALSSVRALVRPASEFVLGNGRGAGELVEKASATSLRWGMAAVVGGLGRLRKVDDALEEAESQVQRIPDQTEDKHQQALWKRAGVVSARKERLQTSIKGHEEEIDQAKAVLGKAYAGVDKFEVSGKDIFKSSRRYKKDNPGQVLEFKIRALARTAKKAGKGWLLSLPVEVQQSLQRLESGQKALKNDKRSLKRYADEWIQLENSLLKVTPAEVAGRTKDEAGRAGGAKAALIRKAAVFGMVGIVTAAATLFFISSVNPGIEGGVTGKETGKTANEVAGEPKAPDGYMKLDDFYRKTNEQTQRFLQLQNRLSESQGENYSLRAKVEELEQQLAETRAALVKRTAKNTGSSSAIYPEHRWVGAVEPVNGRVIDGAPGNIQATFAGRYTIKTGDTLEGVAREIGRSFKLDSETAVFLLAQKEARDNRKRSAYLGTEGEVSDTALLPGEVLDLEGTLALAGQMSTKSIIN